jgi:hypothetical protein
MASVDRMWRILVSVASQLVPTRESRAGSRFSVVALLDVSEVGTTTIIALIIAPGDSDSSKVLTPVSRFLSHFFGPKGPDPGPTPPRNLLHHRLFRWSAQVTVSLDRRPFIMLRLGLCLTFLRVVHTPVKSTKLGTPNAQTSAL